MVYLAGCADDDCRIEEHYVCHIHAMMLWRNSNVCRYGHEILEKLISNLDGTEPGDPRYYAGEWVAEVHGQVIIHGYEVDEVVREAQRQQLAGANIYLAKEE